MFTLEAQLGIFIIVMIYVGLTKKVEEMPFLALILTWVFASAVKLIIINLIGVAIYLIAGWWQL